MIGFRVEILPVPVAEGSAVVSATESPRTGKVYFGLTSKGQMLIEYDPATDRWRDTGLRFSKPASERGSQEEQSFKIHNSLCVDREGILYAAESFGPNYQGGPPWLDMRAMGGAHIWRIDPASGEITDLGQAVRMGAIHAMSVDPAARWAFGYTISDNHFFKFDLKTGEGTDYGQISVEIAAHDVIATDDGDAWIAHCAYRRYDFYKHIYLCKYDHKTDRFLRYDDDAHMISWALAPRVAGNAGVDIFERTRSGLIYGGTAFEGKLFTIDPASDEVAWLGAPPVMSPGIRCIREGPDGIIYGSAGYPRATIFSYDPRTRVFTDHGSPDPTRKKTLYFHGMGIDGDGCLYVGETDAGKCIVYKMVPC